MAYAHKAENRQPGPPQENPVQRQQRRGFFRFWVAATLIGSVLIAALAAYVLITNEGQRLTGIVSMTVVALAVFSALIWLIRYIRKGGGLK